MKTHASLKALLRDLDITTREGRLEFWARWTGGRDPWHIEKVIVTPEFAKWLLSTKDLCINNRSARVSSMRVKELARMMLNGREWISCTPTHLTYTESGLLGNGYGRMSAIILSGATHEFGIQGPMSEIRVSAMDSGTPRTPTDKATMLDNVPGPFQPHLFVTMTEVIRHHVRQDVVPFWNNSAERRSLGSRFRDSYMSMYREVASKRAYRIFRAPEVLAAFCYAHQQEGAPVTAIWRSVVNNDQLVVGSAAHTMLRCIMSTRARRADQRVDLMRRLLHGILAALSNRPLKNLTLKHSSAFDDPTWNAHYMKNATTRGT